jgi:ribosomal protein S16
MGPFNQPDDKATLWIYAVLFVVLITLGLTLTGCAGQATGSFLPDIKTYSPQFQKELKAELPEVRLNAPRTYEFLKDGIKLRDKIRAGKAVQEREVGGSVFKRLEQGR